MTDAQPRLVLCRHGATEHNQAGRFLSRSDPPLSALGREQCERTALAFNDLAFDRCLTSPMRRCLESRAILAPRTPYEVVDALREIDFGAWEGKTLAWLEEHDPQGLHRRRQDPVTFRPPQGESFADVAVRLGGLAAALALCDQRVLVIAHRGTLAVLERLVRGLPLSSQEVKPLEPAEFRALP